MLRDPDLPEMHHVGVAVAEEDIPEGSVVDLVVDAAGKMRVKRTLAMLARALSGEPIAEAEKKRDPLREAAARISDADALICTVKAKACGGDRLALELLAAEARSFHHLLCVVARLRTHPDYQVLPLLTDDQKRAKAALWEIAEAAVEAGHEVDIGVDEGDGAPLFMLTVEPGRVRATYLDENQVPRNQSWLRAQLHFYGRSA